VSYINDLEKLNYYINIKKITIDSSGAAKAIKKAGQQTPKAEDNTENTTSAALLSLDLTAITYWQ
jgi:hypothetical protein